MLQYGPVIGYGTEHPRFWISPSEAEVPARESHIAFVTKGRAEVDAFFRAAVGTGAEVLHEPKVWPEYHEPYYGAFVRDPDGNDVEAVSHVPGWAGPAARGAAGLRRDDVHVGSGADGGRTHSGGPPSATATPTS